MAFSIDDQCIGCTACQNVCPVMAITGERKAQHQINAKRCVSCGVCGKVCPAGAIHNDSGETATKQPRREWLKPAFKTEDCSACSICVDICHFDCITISTPAFKGDLNVYAQLAMPAKCVGCRLCEEACPLNVITMTAGGDA
ncbi:MAG: hypothetical protein PWQ12_1976 [Clostridiales bacterium]|nr:hypothetical protein [Clostridiales bacterium]